MNLLDFSEYSVIYRNATRGVLKGAPADLYPQMKEYLESAHADMLRHIGEDDEDAYRQKFSGSRRLMDSVMTARIKAILKRVETVDYNDLTNEERVMVRRIRDIIEGFKKERGL